LLLLGADHEEIPDCEQGGKQDKKLVYRLAHSWVGRQHHRVNQ